MLQVLSLGPGVSPATLDACLGVIAQNLSLLSIESLALTAHAAVTVACNNGSGMADNVANDRAPHTSIGLLVEDVSAALLSLLRNGRESGSPVRIKTKVSPQTPNHALALPLANPNLLPRNFRSRSPPSPALWPDTALLTASIQTEATRSGGTRCSGGMPFRNSLFVMSHPLPVQMRGRFQRQLSPFQSADAASLRSSSTCQCRLRLILGSI